MNKKIKNKFYYLISFIKPENLPDVLKFFENSEILYFTNQIDNIDYSILKLKIVEKFLVEFNELMMIFIKVDENSNFIINDDYDSRNHKRDLKLKSIKEECLKLKSQFQAEKKV